MPAKDRIGNELKKGDMVAVVVQGALTGFVLNVEEGGMIAKATPDLRGGMQMPGRVFVCFEFLFDPRQSGMHEFFKIVSPNTPDSKPRFIS